MTQKWINKLCHNGTATCKLTLRIVFFTHAVYSIYTFFFISALLRFHLSLYIILSVIHTKSCSQKMHYIWNVSDIDKFDIVYTHPCLSFSDNRITLLYLQWYIELLFLIVCFLNTKTTESYIQTQNFRLMEKN